MSSLRAVLLLLFAVAIAAFAVVAAGCDSAGTVIETDASDAGPDHIVVFDGPTPFEAAPAVDAGGGEAAPAGDAAAFAFIDFSEVPVGGGEFTAAFFATPPAPPAGCTTQLVDGGACLVTTCAAHAASDAGVVSLASAGALDLSGGAFGDAGVQIGADNLGSYLYNTTGPMFAPGDTLTVSGAGATVPAFPAQSLVAPDAIVVTAPAAAADAGALVISTTTDVAVAWTGGATGNRVVFTLSAFFKSGASASTTCSWDAAAGQATIPASAVTGLAGNAQAGGSTVVWYEQAQTSFTTGRWAVTMRAAIHGGSPATFQ